MPLLLTKKEPYFEPDDSWLVVDLLNHRPEQIQIRDPANNKIVTTVPTSPNEIFLKHGDVFSATQVLPKVHILLGGLVRYEDLSARGDKPLNVKSSAQEWLDELSTLLASGNSPFTIEQDEALASLINRQAAPLLNLPVKPIDEQSAFRPDEKIGVFFYHLLALLNKTDFITAKQRIGTCGADESEGAIIDVPQRHLALKSLLAIRHSEGQDKADYAYQNDKLAKIANYYSVSALTSDGTGDDNDLESKLNAEVKQATEHDQLTEIESLYFNAIKLLKHLREPGIIRHVETRREYQLKTTKLDYRYIELKQLDFISLKLHRNYRYQISSADNSVQLVGRFNPSDNVNVKIPAKWSSVETWYLTATPVENDFVDALFPNLKSQYQNMLSMPGFTVGEGDVGIAHANLMVGADKSLRNLNATIQIASGAMSLYLAAAIGATGVGAPLAGAIGFIGLDNVQAGVRTLFSEDTTSTYGAQFLEMLGVPKDYSELVYGMADISIISKAGYTLKATNQVYNIIKVKPIAGMKPQQMVKPENISVTVENITKNQPHVIDLKNVDDTIAGKGTTATLSKLPQKWKLKL